MKKRFILVFVCGYLLLGPSAKALSPTIYDKVANLSHFTPITTAIVDNEICDIKNPLN